MLNGHVQSLWRRGLTFHAKLKKTLIQDVGTGVPTFSRSTTATVTDFEGVVRTAGVGEARFNGMRRVQNLYVNGSTLVTQGVTTAAGQYIVSFYGTGSVTLSGTATGTLNGTGASNRVSLLVTTTAGTLTSTVTGSCTSAQLENVTGQSVQTVGDYVPTGTGGPVYGAQLVSNPGPLTSTTGYTASGSGSVAANAGALVVTNTAASYGNAYIVVPTVVGVVYTVSFGLASSTVASSTSAMAGTSPGNPAYANPTFTAAGTQSFQFTATTTTTYVTLFAGQNTINATSSWTSVSVQQCLYSGAGVDGVAYFDTTLTGARVSDPNTYSGMPAGYLNEPSGTNLLLNSAAPVTQNITTTAQQYTVSFWGTGTCVLSGTATGTLNGTGATARVSLTVTATAGALTLTFSGSTSNGQCEACASATSYIPTTSAAVTRTADSLTYPLSGQVDYNLLLNSYVPATQSVTCTATAYTLALTGTGSVTLSGAGSGTLSGTGTSMVLLHFTPSAGSVTFTVSGPVTSFGLFNSANTPLSIPLTTTVADSNSQGTFCATLAAQGATSGTYPGVCLSDGTTNNVVGFDTAPLLGLLSLLVKSASVSSSSQPAINAAFAAKTANRSATSWKQGRQAGAANGAAPVSWTGSGSGNAMPAALNTVNASSNNSNVWNGTVTDISVYSTALPDTRLTEMTVQTA